MHNLINKFLLTGSIVTNNLVEGGMENGLGTMVMVHDRADFPMFLMK